MQGCTLQNLQQWIWDWSMMIEDIQRLLKLLRPTSSSTSCKAPLPSDKVTLHIDPLAHCLVHLREVSLQVFHARDVLHLLRYNQLMVVLAYCSLRFQDSRLHNSNSNIGTNNQTAKPPVIQRIVFSSFSHSTAILCDLYTNFNQACIPCIPPSKNVQYLCLTADHLQSCTQWHNECLQQTQGAGLGHWWGFILIHMLQTSEEATAQNHSMKTPCDGKHQVHLYRSIPIICAYMYSTYVHTYAYIIIYVSVNTFVFDSIQYPLKYETTPTYATYVIHPSHRSIHKGLRTKPRQLLLSRG